MCDNSDDLDDEADMIIRTSSQNQIVLIEGPSSNVITTPDESSNDSTPSTSAPSTSNSEDTSLCDTCQKSALLKVFKQKVSTTGGKQEDIFRHYCEECQHFFGICSKKVRGSFVYVTEEGRILTNAEKMEHFREEKRKRSLSRGNSEVIAVEENSDTSTNGNNSNDNGKEEAEPVAETGGTAQKTLRKPVKKPFFGGTRKKTNWGNKSRLKRKQAEKEEREALGLEPLPKPKRTVVTTQAKKKLEEKKIVEEKKRGRPTRSVTSSTPEKPSTSTPIKRNNSNPVINQFVIRKETSECSAQTDDEMLLKSKYLGDVFETSLQNVLGEQIANRLQGQPLLLKKKFMVMMKTIEEQEQQLQSYRTMSDKFKTAVEQFRNFGRATRLTYSEDLQMIRIDMLERKEEFRTHQAEVLSLLNKQRNKYEAHKEQMNKKYEDHKLEMTNMEAKMAFLEQEKKYEFDRAEYLLRCRDVSEKERNEAVETADSAVKKLNDRLWVANNEKCTSCQFADKSRTRMAEKVAEMQTERDSAVQERDVAVAERNQAVEKAAMYEAAAHKLGKDCDSVKYERDSWKAYAEKFKKDMNKMAQNLKEKERELLEKTEALASTPKHIITPRSIACTPNDADRVSPPEEGELLDTPPQSSPASQSSKPPTKTLAQKVVEKKAAPQIASGFESWIPKDKVDAPAPNIPKAMTAFGPPVKTPQQREAEKAKLAITQQQTPWERAALPTGTSNSLTEALSKVQADSFFGGASGSGGGNKTPAYVSKSFTEEMNKQMKARKRTSDVPAADEQKKSTNPSPAPPPKKQKQTPTYITPATPTYSSPGPSGSSTSSGNPGSSGIGSLSNMKKIPRLSDKPPQAEFAPALGIRDQSDSGGIPGLEDVEEGETSDDKAPALGKILPAVPVEQKLVQQKSVETPKPNVPKVVPKVSSNPSTSSAPSNKNNAPNKQTTTPPKNKKKKKGAHWDHAAQKLAKPWDNRATNAPMTPAWRTGSAYGIQPQQSSHFMGGFGDARPWCEPTGSDRGSGGGSSFSSLPWHRSQDSFTKTQDTPFGKVPIQDSFPIGGPLPMARPAPTSFYGSPDPGRSFYATPPQQQQPRYQPPPMYSPPPPTGRNPRSFYG